MVFLLSLRAHVQFRRKPTCAEEEVITTRLSRRQNFLLVRQIWESAQSVGKRFRDNLVFVLVDNVTDTLSFDHPNAYSVVLKDGDHLADTRDVLLRRIFEPRDCPVLLSVMRRLSGCEAGWFFQMSVKPFSQFIEMRFFVRVQFPRVTQVVRRLKYAELAFGIVVNFRNYKPDVHSHERDDYRSLPLVQ